MDGFSSKEEGESQWLPISDLMSVLMMIFLLIAVSYMLKVYLEKEKIEEVAITYNKLQGELYEDLNEEFKEDLKEWDAEIDKQNLSVRFKSPDILFSYGKDELKPEFKKILREFFPRFINILHQEKYRNDIEEIRIEGHTSQESESNSSYIFNMDLSQRRTTNVLAYVLRLDNQPELTRWIRSNVTANGLSSSKLIFNNDGTQNNKLSRRVEFRVKTNAEQRIAKILSQ